MTYEFRDIIANPATTVDVLLYLHTTHQPHFPCASPPLVLAVPTHPSSPPNPLADETARSAFPKGQRVHAERVGKGSRVRGLGV